MESDHHKPPHPVDILVGARVKAARVSRGLTQTALAERLGLTFQQVQKYERGANRISTVKLVEIAGVMEMPPAAFLATLDEDGLRAQDLSGLTAPGATELLVAYASLSAREQRAVLKLARTLAESDDAAGLQPKDKK